MRTIIYCRPTGNGMHSFYLSVGSSQYFLFSQNYRKGVAAFYGQGVILEMAVDFSRAHGDRAITKTMSKIPSYIRAIEKEYHIEILRQTRRRNARSYYSGRKCA